MRDQQIHGEVIILFLSELEAIRSLVRQPLYFFLIKGPNADNWSEFKLEPHLWMIA